jgi:hypothetical protein
MTKTLVGQKNSGSYLATKQMVSSSRFMFLSLLHKLTVIELTVDPSKRGTYKAMHIDLGAAKFANV